jgi:hypothetical protein
MEELTEDVKSKIDVAKHLSTLNTGTIVVVATFWGKFPHAVWTALVDYSVTFLLASLATCVIYLTWEPMRFRWLLRVAGASFYVGTMLLGLFASVNFAFGSK